jgi:hypothetical protein
MDDDEDGFISGTRINILGLKENILRLISPLLSEMEEVNAELDE